MGSVIIGVSRAAHKADDCWLSEEVSLHDCLSAITSTATAATAALVATGDGCCDDTPTALMLRWRVSTTSSSVSRGGWAGATIAISPLSADDNELLVASATADRQREASSPSRPSVTLLVNRLAPLCGFVVVG